MRVLLANKFLHPRGGAERAVLALGAGLTSRGHTVSYFGTAHPENRVQGEHVEVVPARDYHAAGMRRYRDAAAMLYSVAARRKFDAFLRRTRADVVHVHNIYHQLTPSILDAALARGVPVLMTVHDYKLVCPRYDMMRHGSPCDACLHVGPLACLRYRCAGSWAASALLAAESALHAQRGSYDAVRLFLVPSRFMAGILARGGIDKERLRHVPNFADAGELAAAFEPQPDRFVYAGRLSAEKGLRTLLHAASRLRQGTLVLCGSGALEPELRAIAAAATPGRIEFRGHLPAEALWREIGLAQFSVLPSECLENAPFAVLESMALGRAVLATGVGGVPELVIPGMNGELLPTGDIAAWSERLQAALAAPERMRRLGAGALQAARSRHTLEQHLDATERAYAEVVA